MEFCYEHKFQRFAFSFCKGHFGGVKGKEFLCIVHINSSLSFYEQEGIAYQSTLPGERNIPSVLCYVPRIDSFITISPGYELECFRYSFCMNVENFENKLLSYFVDIKNLVNQLKCPDIVNQLGLLVLENSH